MTICLERLYFGLMASNSGFWWRPSHPRTIALIRGLWRFRFQLELHNQSPVPAARTIAEQLAIESQDHVLHQDAVGFRCLNAGFGRLEVRSVLNRCGR